MTPKKFFYVLIGGLVLVTVLFAVGYNAGIKELSSQHEDIATLKAQIDAVDEKLSLTIQTEAQLEQLGFIDTIANEVLPQEKYQPELVSQLFLLADNNNMTITAVTFSAQDIKEQEGQLVVPEVTQAQPLTDAPGVFVVPINLSARGDYQNFVNFLDDIETNRRKLQVNSININPEKSDDGSPSGIVQVSIGLDVYVKP